MRRDSPSDAAGAWDPVWRRSSYARADRRAARARAKVAALVTVGFDAADGERVLDLGCGSGDATVELAARARGRARWIACDRSGVAAEGARATFVRRRLDAAVVTADAAALPFRTRSIDAAVAFMLLQHLGRPDAVLAELARVLVAGGRLAVVVPGRWSLASATNVVRRAAGWWPYDPRTYTADDLRALLAPRFDVAALRAFPLAFDRPIEAVVDRVLGAVVPAWGRYLVARCRSR